MPYDVALICKNGHIVNAYSKTYPETNSPFCSKCGSETINKCPSCHKEIRGHSTGEYSYMYDYVIPAYCEHCGSAFPWTESAIVCTSLILSEENNLSENEKDLIINSLPDIISETPKTNLAIIYFKKALSSSGKFVADSLKQFIIDFGCEIAKKSIGL